ncbi:MAG TPA: DUF456 domain-containing protein [Bacteroidia bacterium]|nr:DUF456 domain-containing protein [Bacteroidia bacterium]
METLLIILAILCLFAGLAGCVLPAIPGPPLSFAGMLLVQWAWQPFSTSTLIIFGIITAAVTVLDYFIPVWGGKIFGATRYGIYGSIIGMVAGMFLTPAGMIAGLLLGAILGDMIAGRKFSDAIGSGLGTFLGTMAGMAVKLIVSGIMTFMVFYKIAGWISNL